MSPRFGSTVDSVRLSRLASPPPLCLFRCFQRMGKKPFSRSGRRPRWARSFKRTHQRKGYRWTLSDSPTTGSAWIKILLPRCWGWKIRTKLIAFGITSAGFGIWWDPATFDPTVLYTVFEQWIDERTHSQIQVHRTWYI